MKKAAVFLADGFEEVEALTQVDLLRRAGIDVKMVSVKEGKEVLGAHNICVKADILFNEAENENFDAAILPGGMPGTLNLQNHEGLSKLIDKYYKDGKIVAAICAAPMILGQMGILEGKKACCYPGFEKYLDGADAGEAKVSKDGNVITSRGVGTAIAFAAEIITSLLDGEKAKEVLDSIIYK